MSETSLHEFADWVESESVDYPVVCVAVYYAYTTGLDDDLVMVIDRYGWTMIPDAVQGTVDYLEGRVTRRGVADNLDVDAGEGIALTQAVERVIRVVGGVDPDIAAEDFEVRLSRETGPLIRIFGESR